MMCWWSKHIEEAARGSLSVLSYAVEIDAPLFINLLRLIEAKGSLETVKRLSQRLNEVMNYEEIDEKPGLGSKVHIKEYAKVTTEKIKDKQDLRWYLRKA